MFMLSSIPLAGVTDGTSNTIFASERAHGRFPAGGHLLLELVDLGQLRRHHVHARSIRSTRSTRSPTSAAWIAARMPMSPRRPASTPAARTSASATARSSSSRTRSARGRSSRTAATRPMNAGGSGNGLPGRREPRQLGRLHLRRRHPARRLPAALDSQRRRGHQLRPVLIAERRQEIGVKGTGVGSDFFHTRELVWVQISFKKLNPHPFPREKMNRRQFPRVSAAVGDFCHAQVIG